MNIFDPIPSVQLFSGLPPFWREEDAAVKPGWDRVEGPIVTRVDVVRPTLSFFPATGARPRPCVVVCPGGGYSALAWNHEGLDVAHWLLSIGISAAVLEYRVPARRDAALADARRAMRLVRAKASEWRVDPGNVGILGFSAGGHLAIRVCCSTEPEAAAPDGADDIDALSARPDFALPIYPAYVDSAPDGGIDPNLKIGKDFPPAFVALSCDDPLASSALAFASALRAAGARFELHVFESGGHGWGVPAPDTVQSKWMALAADWLVRRTRRPRASSSSAQPIGGN